MRKSSSRFRQLVIPAAAALVALVAGAFALPRRAHAYDLIAVRTACASPARCRMVSNELARLRFTTLVSIGADVRFGFVGGPSSSSWSGTALARIAPDSRPADLAGRIASRVLASRGTPDTATSGEVNGPGDMYEGLRGTALALESILADSRLSRSEKISNIADLAALTGQDFRDTMEGSVGYLLTFIQSPGEEGEVWTEEEIETYSAYAAEALLGWAYVADPALALRFRLDVRSPFTDPEITNIDTHIWSEDGEPYEEGIWLRSVARNAGFDHRYRTYSYDLKLYNDAYRNGVNSSSDASEHLDKSFPAFFVHTEHHDVPAPGPTWYHVQQASWVPYGVFTGTVRRTAPSGSSSTLAHLPLITHETGHLFWALDEYPGACEAKAEGIASAADYVIELLTAYGIDVTAWVAAIESAIMSIYQSPNCEVDAPCIMNHSELDEWLPVRAPIVDFWTGQEIWGRVWGFNHPTVELFVDRWSDVGESVEIDGAPVGESPLVRYLPEGVHTVCGSTGQWCQTLDLRVERADRATGEVCGRAIDVTAEGVEVLDPCY